MKAANRHSRARAFTQVELLAVLAALLIPAFMLFPSFPRARSCGSRISCVNRLKQVGLAYRIWSNENGDKFPWAVSITNGGTLEIARTAAAWRHFQVISNEVTSPKVFVCPTDNRKRETNWVQFNGNQCLSYFAGLDADETRPQTVLSGDRNLKTALRTRNGILRITGNALPTWTEGIHNLQGNLGLGDGSVQQTSTNSLRSQFRAALSVATSTNRPVIRLAIPE